MRYRSFQIISNVFISDSSKNDTNRKPLSIKPIQTYFPSILVGRVLVQQTKGPGLEYRLKHILNQCFEICLKWFVCSFYFVFLDNNFTTRLSLNFCLDIRSCVPRKFPMIQLYFYYVSLRRTKLCTKSISTGFSTSLIVTTELNSYNFSLIRCESRIGTRDIFVCNYM